MASTAALREGQRVIIESGPFGGKTAIVLDPKAMPDSPENEAAGIQRKVRVAVLLGENGEETHEEYILPRLLDIGGDLPLPQTARLTQNQLEGHVAPAVLTRSEPITDPMDPALDRFRPSQHVVKKYISRVIPGCNMTDIDFLLSMREQRDDRGFSPNLALVGETQSGKTMLVEVLACIAAERDGLPKPYPVFTLSGSSGITSYDLYGQTTAVEINGRETLVWMEGMVPMAARCGAFLYLDEWNAVPPSQAVAVHPLLDDRRKFVNYQRAIPDGHGGWAPEVVEAHNKMWVISTINPGYKGTQTMAEATSNRFRWLPWDYDKETEATLVPSTTVRLMGERLREARQSRILTVPVGTSALQRFNADLAIYGVDTALWVFKGLFPPNERTRVEAIIEDGGMLDLLLSEYPPGGNVASSSSFDTDDDSDD